MSLKIPSDLTGWPSAFSRMATRINALLKVARMVSNMQGKGSVKVDVSGENIVISGNDTVGGGGGGAAPPWKFEPNEAVDEVSIVGQAILVDDIVAGTTETVTGLTGLTLGTATTYWLVGAFDATGGYTGWSVSTTAPSGDNITWGASPNFYQTGAWYQLARVVSGSHPELPGFDFTSGGNPYHLEQIVSTPLLLARGAVNGRLVWYPTPL